ncbi:histone-fold-containing protein [Lobosporangium transversale]|uniref:Histone-fold-containing protein n=1 Tax=Lobosporangium transversale TaxID=64571 RepID=A0A1Y2GVD0_9FUNG|nr:histone-fold-containing protein [Lobosporangium transversale]ORZ26258.1 histone-fold-containing protein [Lobosporangium transversale]|eukprot:XP_021884023.1 histone-fold-containing protein [Lobosporangium transversale]
MASSKSKSTGANTAKSGRVQKKTPTKTSAKTSTGSASTSEGSAVASASALGGSALYSGKAKGVTKLPAARVKRIIKEDKDVQMVSNDAVFLISMATEFFLESFTKKAFNLARIGKRKTVSYMDLATAVTQHDSLEFLQDVVPKTMTLTAALEKQRLAKEKDESGPIEDDEEGEGEGDHINSDQENERSGSEGPNSSRPISDDEELSAPEDMDED